MRLISTFLFSLLGLSLAAAGSWAGYGAWLESQVAKVEIREVSALTVRQEKILPFFELMSPLPSLDEAQILPKLEYKKGPPERFIERISVILQRDPKGPKERVTYHGRHTRTDLSGLAFFPEGPAREARYVEAALRFSQGTPVPDLHGLQAFLLRPLLLREATRWLAGMETVYIMDQAGTPAFLFESARSESGRSKALALFVRRNSFYRVDYSADRGFSSLNPLDAFRKSFLTERRADALEFLARNLSEVKMEKSSASLRFRDIAWPILLLAANVSVDPTALDAYFHFAGISALLYRNESVDASDLETIDILRNNVLASEAYARDVSPNATKTAEIARLARLLTRNLE